NAMGVAQGARSEAETALKSWVDRWLAERDFVTREEFEAVREMAVKARTENSELRARLDRLDPAGASAPSAALSEPPSEPVSEAQAPPSHAMGNVPAETPAGEAGAPVSEVEAPASHAMGDRPAETAATAAGEPVSEADAPASHAMGEQ